MTSSGIAKKAAVSAAPKRHRRTKREIEAIRRALADCLEGDNPQTVRGAFYRMTTEGMVPKTEAGYGTVKRLLAQMRRSGEIPYSWIADGTRWMRRPTTYDSVEDALRSTAATYRRALWSDSPVAVEVWCEKEALAGVLVEVTDVWDVPLMVTRGYPSLSFLHSAAETIHERDKHGKQTAIYYFGDHDPSGTDIDRAIRQGIGESLLALEPPWLDIFAVNRPDADQHEQAFDDYATFERVAVTGQQISAWNLPTRPTKSSDSRSAKFKGDSVELDAISPARLRQLAEQAIEGHVDRHRLKVLRVAEEEERRGLEQLAAGFVDLGSQGGDGP